MRLVVTRDHNQLSELIAEARSRSVELIPLPLTSIEPVDFTWPLDNCERIDWLVFTSAHGVDNFFERVSKSPHRIDSNTNIAVVGGKTAAAVIRHGHPVAFVPSDSYGETLFGELLSQHVKSGDTLVYARAEEVVTDPAKSMKKSGVNYREIVCYRSVPIRSDRGSIEILNAGDRILFTAPSKVTTYHSQFGKPKARPIAIGKTTAEEMQKLGWDDIDILSATDIVCVWEQL